MIIYFALLIPIITAIVLYFWFSRKTLWWEFAVPFVLSLILILSAKAIIEISQVDCKEYWGSFISRIEYYEEWDEWISQTCTRQCCCDSKGENCSTETYDCSYRRYHSPYWQIITTTGETVDISEQEYNRLTKLFGNQKFTDMGRDYYTIDGDKYSCEWMRDSAKAVPVTTVHTYENRIKAADQSVFHFRKVDTSDIKMYGLKEYPSINDDYKQDALMGEYTKDGELANKKLQYINGLLGSKKQVKVFVIVFRDKPIEAALYQESYWSGANMNEFVVCIGMDNARNVKWCYPISWTTSEKLKVDVRQFVTSQSKLNLCSLADYIKVQVDKQFVRRDFKEFDYLTVEPSAGAIIFTFILTILVNLGLSFWIISNEYEEWGEDDDRRVSFDRIRNLYKW